MRFWRASSLRARLLLLVSLGGVPSLGVILYEGFQDRRQAAASANSEALGLARAASIDQQRLVLDTRQLLTLLAELPQIDPSDPDSCAIFLRQFLDQGSPYANLGVIQPNGDVVCSAVPFTSTVTAADRPYFQEAARNRRFSIGDFQVGRITRVATVNFGFPLQTPEGGLRGVVFAALPLSWLEDRIAAAQLPAGSTVTVVDRSLTILTRYPDNAEWMGKSVRGLPIAEAIQSTGGSGTIVGPGVDGEQRLYAVTPLLDLPGAPEVHLAVGIPTRVAYAAANRDLLRNLAALLVLAILVLTAAWWGSNVFVLRQVRALLKATRRLAAGELSSRAPTSDTGGEISELAASFNDMAGALEVREKEASENLARIARLNRVYAVLSGINSALLRIRTTEELLPEVCRIAVEHGGFGLAVIHRTGPDDGLVVAASAGQKCEGAPAPAPGESANEVDLVHRAAKEGKDLILTQAGRDGLGYHSVAALPLEVAGEVAGVLSLYTDDPHFFDSEELHLLRDLAADTALGLEYLEKERRLQYVSQYDTLTDLPNRALFEDRLEQAIAQAKLAKRLVAVLVVEVIQLPEIHAAIGHSAGDHVLQTIGKNLSLSVREGDTVSRLGSQEFGILLGDLWAFGEVQALIGPVLDGAPSVVSWENHEIFVSLRSGVAVYPHDGEHPEMLIQKATLACHATSPGADSPLSFVSETMNTELQRRREIERELRHAVERNELALLYQPVVEVSSRQVVGVEALIRWSNPALGDLSPAVFIPVAEETGLITRIGEWIVSIACAQGHLWHAAGHRIRINVNVSVDQLRQPGYVTRLAELLAEAEFEPRAVALGIEITESELMTNVDDAVASILKFREMGLAVYIDDFGTGYSSLSYLRKLPIDTLKIDASFIRDIPQDADAVAVVGGIIAMARSLELRVIAEGVETEEQFATLARFGCDAVQGYLFSRPAQPEEIEKLFGRRL